MFHFRDIQCVMSVQCMHNMYTVCVIRQVYDATNTTRERRDLILENSIPYGIKVYTMYGAVRPCGSTLYYNHISTPVHFMIWTLLAVLQ